VVTQSQIPWSFPSSTLNFGVAEQTSHLDIPGHVVEQPREQLDKVHASKGEKGEIGMIEIVKKG
jgi:hypothetical protein